MSVTEETNENTWSAVLELQQAKAQVIETQNELAEKRVECSLLRGVIDNINFALNETANRSEWCSEFDDRIRTLWATFPDSLNIELIPRKHKWSLEVEVSGTITETYCVEIEAATLDEAIDMAREEINSEGTLGGESVDQMLTSSARIRTFEIDVLDIEQN